MSFTCLFAFFSPKLNTKRIELNLQCLFSFLPVETVEILPHIVIRVELSTAITLWTRCSSGTNWTLFCPSFPPQPTYKHARDYKKQSRTKLSLKKLFFSWTFSLLQDMVVWSIKQELNLEKISFIPEVNPPSKEKKRSETSKKFRIWIVKSVVLSRHRTLQFAVPCVRWSEEPDWKHQRWPRKCVESKDLAEKEH